MAKRSFKDQKSSLGGRSKQVKNSVPQRGSAGSQSKKEAKFTGDSNGSQVKKKPTLLLEPTPSWYEVASLEELSPVGDESVVDSLTPEAKAGLLKISNELLEEETEAYIQISSTSSSQRQFFTEIMNAGTLSDRISALTLLIQESPLHATRSLNGLFAIAKKKNRTAALQAIESLKDLFTNGAVLPDRKLVWFMNQKRLASLKQFMDNNGQQLSKLYKQWMIIWAFEDWLKQFYFTFVQLLERLSHDPVVHVRASVLTDIIDLLKEKPEQEVNLLRLAVNKLGDSDRKTASKASFLMLGLEQAHPAMKRVIVNAISELSFRPHADYHAKYYSMITLNQTIITARDNDLANTLISIYFKMFELLITESKNIKDKQISAKKVKKGRWKSNKKTEQKSNKTTNLQGKDKDISSEALEEANMRMFSAILTGLNRVFPYSSLDGEVFKQHLESVYKVARSGNFNTRVQALIFLYQVSSADQVQSDRFYATLYESLLDPRVILSSKQALYLNLVYKSIKNDISSERVKAFVKRLVQIALETLNIGFCSGVIYMLSELESSAPYIRGLITDPVSNGDEDEEVFKDVPEDDVEQSEFKIATSKELNDKSWEILYDGKTHDPLRANASFSNLWELALLKKHFHPTVVHFATSFMEHSDPGSRPDLALYTLTHFLDRFVYKTPKSKSKSKEGGNSSIMQPFAQSSAYAAKDILLLSTKSSRKDVPAVNSINWAAIDAIQLKATSAAAKAANVEEAFFTRYFLTKGTRSRTEKDIGTNINADMKDQDKENEIDEEEVWDAMVRSRGDIENADISDGDYEEDGALAEALAGDDSDEEADLSNEGIDDFEDESASSSAEDDTSDDQDDEKLEELVAEDNGGDLEDVEIDDDDKDDEFESELAELFAKENEELNSDEDEFDEPVRGEKQSGKRKDQDGQKSDQGKRRKKFKDLPMFASVDDYKNVLSASDEE
ncbi:CBF/Mak21 family-domain-containing protein [Dipodascopsis uninucleata]